MTINDSFSGVSNCYVFKSRLQEYAQKVGLPTPVYETTKEGPSHEPFFRSTVILNNARYDSLPGFSNRKAAEQSAAEVALSELAKFGDFDGCISQPVHETGLCKNLLQEYAQKMNFAIPSYECQKDETLGKLPLFSCTVEIGGILYIGTAAQTKKEAEIKAARTALLAIRSGGFSEKSSGNSQLTVVPCKRKGTDSNDSQEEAAKVLKPKKERFKKKQLNYTLSANKVAEVENFRSLEGNVNVQTGSVIEKNNTSVALGAGLGTSSAGTVRNFQDDGNFRNGQLTASNANLMNNENPKSGVTPELGMEDLVALVKEANKVSGVGPGDPMVTTSAMVQIEASDVISCNRSCAGETQP